MAVRKYLTELDKAAAGLNPFLIVIAIGLSLVDFTLGMDRLRDIQAGLPPLFEQSVPAGLDGNSGYAVLSSPEVMGAVGSM